MLWVSRAIRWNEELNQDGKLGNAVPENSCQGPKIREMAGQTGSVAAGRQEAAADSENTKTATTSAGSVSQEPLGLQVKMISILGIHYMNRTYVGLFGAPGKIYGSLLPT